MNNVTILFDDEMIDREKRMAALFDIWSAMTPEDPNKEVVWNEMIELGGAMSPASFASGVTQGGRAQAPKKTGITQDVEQALPEAQQ